MKNRIVTSVIAVLLVASFAWSLRALTLTDVDTAKYQEPTGLKALTTVIDANNAMIETSINNPTNSNTAVFSSNITVKVGSTSTTLHNAGTGAMTTPGTLTVNGAATFTSTVIATGKVTMAAIPALSAAVGTANNVTVTITNAPTGTDTVAKWGKIILADGTTNVFPCFQIP
jgi:hypothetical protein